jgi:hypothetical protein
MNGQSFSLEPFPLTDPFPLFKIVGTIGRRTNILTVRYALIGHLTDLVIPEATSLPARRNGLWEQTCFELFLARKDSPR